MTQLSDEMMLPLAGQRTKYRPAIAAAVLLFLILSLTYRVIDLGVSLDFTQSQLEETIERSHVLEEFQRRTCTDAYQKIDGVSVFEKGRHIVVRGVPFECRTEKDDVPRLYSADQ